VPFPTQIYWDFPHGNHTYLYGIARDFLGFNGIIWDENKSQSYPQVLKAKMDFLNLYEWI
jgi:hypothetical protein